jgi:hypothetical protein
MAYKGCDGDYWIMVAFLTSTFFFFLRSRGSVAIDTLQLFEAKSLTHRRGL